MGEIAPNSVILNERQYQERMTLLKELRRSIAGLPSLSADLKAQMTALMTDLEATTGAYITLKGGSIRRFETQTIEDLPEILIRARLAQGMKRADLGALLGTHENQVQRYERERFQTMSFHRLLAITKILKLNLSGVWEIR